MKSRIELTVLNWRYWVALPVLALFFPVLIAQATCRGLAVVFNAADEAIEDTFDAPADLILRFVQKHKHDKVMPANSAREW